MLEFNSLLDLLLKLGFSFSKKMTKEVENPSKMDLTSLSLEVILSLRICSRNVFIVATGYLYTCCVGSFKCFPVLCDILLNNEFV